MVKMQSAVAFLQGENAKIMPHRCRQGHLWRDAQYWTHNHRPQDVAKGDLNQNMKVSCRKLLFPQRVQSVLFQWKSSNFSETLFFEYF